MSGTTAPCGVDAPTAIAGNNNDFWPCVRGTAVALPRLTVTTSAARAWRAAILLTVLLCPAGLARGQDAQAPDAPITTDCDQPSTDKDQGKAPDRIFGVLPNYTTVDRATPFAPIGTKQMFHLAALSTFDPYVYPFVGFVAALGAGEGSANFGRRYATAFADNAIGNFMTTAIMPSLVRTDPRYFELGSGSGLHRAGYALSRIVLTRSREGAPRFNFAEIGGNGAAAALSNLYYLPQNQSLSNTLTRWGSQILWDAASNELKEFWPDIRRRIRRP